MWYIISLKLLLGALSPLLLALNRSSSVYPGLLHTRRFQIDQCNESKDNILYFINILIFYEHLTVQTIYENDIKNEISILSGVRILLALVHLRFYNI